MAYLFPNAPAGVLPPEVLRTFSALKLLPKRYVVWHHLAPWQKDAPDFLVLNEQQQALLVKVSSAAARDARPAAQLLLLDADQAPLGTSEASVLEVYLRQLDADLGNCLCSVILFPNIPEKSLSEARPSDSAGNVTWLGAEALLPTRLAEWAKLFTKPALEPVRLERLRSKFCPEVIVPSALTVRQPTPHRLAAGLTEYLLDYDQEAALKYDLDLPEEAAEFARDFRLNILNGVAGSGKTLILLYRLRLLHVLFPNKRFLVLTHNRPLIRDLQARFYQLHKSLPESIEWQTFASWCNHHWPARPGWIEPLGQQRRADLICQAHQHTLVEGPVSPGMLSSEIDWIKDRLIESEEVYQTAERRGRGFRLSQEQRSQVYQAFQLYQSRLESRGQLDWGDVPRHMWQFFEDGRVSPPQYDVVLVDEAQFFAPLWFEIVRRLVQPASGHLFLAADPTQGFLRRGASWKALAGLDVRGRTHHLQRSYRTTREILDFATLFYRQRVKDENDEEVLAPNLINMPNGVVPVLIPLASSQDEIARAANEIAAIASQGHPLKDILVLHANWQGVKALLQALERRLGKGKAFDPKDQFPGNYVRVTTLNAGTGLESPIVFLVGLHELFEEEQSLRLSDVEREALVLDNTRKIYMAITRAGQRLILTYVGELPAELKRLYRTDC